jgi:hypothetical protein
MLIKDNELTQAENEAYAAMIAEDARNNFSNERLLKFISKIRGASFEKNLRMFLDDVGGVCGRFEIVRKPMGQFVREKWGPIGGHWVDQRAAGISGDSFAGEIYIQVTIKKPRFIQFNYSC